MVQGLKEEPGEVDLEGEEMAVEVEQRLTLAPEGNIE